MFNLTNIINVIRISVVVIIDGQTGWHLR